MLIDLSDDLYAPPKPSTTRQVISLPVPEQMVTAAVTVTPEPAPVIAPVPGALRASYLAVEDVEWTWKDLRDYVVSQLAQRRIAYPSIPAERLASIFKGFSKRWGDKAPAIARYAFDICDGYWLNAPITPARFAANSDPYFADTIAPRLVSPAA